MNPEKVKPPIIFIIPIREKTHDENQCVYMYKVNPYKDSHLAILNL